MAKRKPGDNGIQSQTFFRAFYRFYKCSHEAWYIKDPEHRYVDASVTFLSRFLPTGFTSVVGLSDHEMTSVPESFVEKMHAFESMVTGRGKEIILLSWRYFSDNEGVNAFILRIKPYPYGKKMGVMVYVFSLVEFNKRIEWLPSIISSMRASIPQEESTHSTCFNPCSYVTGKEWEVAWLLICGVSIRGIAKYLNVRNQTVSNKIRNVYLKLRVSGKSGLLKMANRHEWINLIPERYFSSSALVRIR